MQKREQDRPIQLYYILKIFDFIILVFGRGKSKALPVWEKIGYCILIVSGPDS
jgi:hypothetical protein